MCPIRFIQQIFVKHHVAKIHDQMDFASVLSFGAPRSSLQSYLNLSNPFFHGFSLNGKND